MGGEPSAAARPAWRYTAVILFLALWMACGWLLRLDANAYLLWGVPLTVLFPLLVRRQSLRALWVRGAPAFRLAWTGLLIALGLSIIPLLELVIATAAAEAVAVLFSLCSIVGAVAAAYALRHFDRASLRPLILCLVICLGIDAALWAVFLGSGMMELGAVEGGWPVRIAVGLVSLIQYLAVVFAVEEVSFRMLDGHLHQGRRDRGILSALAISAAWGLWHLPIAGDIGWGTVAGLLLVHVPYGVCLSLFWRRSGNLWVPGLSHALGDAIRNAIVFSG
jgi:membrane protease YdiL (CAAX protease family)